MSPTKKMSKNIWSSPHRNKLVRSILVTILLSLILLLFILSSYGIIHKTYQTSHYENHIIKSSITSLKLNPLRSVKEERSLVIKVNQIARKVNPFVPPFNVSKEERIKWLLQTLPSMEIFKPEPRFHSRVVEFFDPRCDIRVFMTWISPVELFGTREFLSLETFFKAHPKGCLMILSRTMDSVQGYRILKPLIDRGLKVHPVAPDLRFLVKGTPGEIWLDQLKSGNKDPGEISLAQNLSNLMRLVALYKYGGVYLDTDFVVTKPLTGLRNCLGAQSVDPVSKNWTRLNNAVLIFDMNHPLLWSFIEEFGATFDGNKWGHNGPYLVSRVARRVGPVAATGLNFTVLSPMAFYPVDWNRIGGLFLRPQSEDQAKWVKAKLVQLSGETFGVHLWNKQSNKLVIQRGSVIGNLISDNCIICKDIYSS